MNSRVMHVDRRNFLRRAGMAGLAMSAGSGLASGAAEPAGTPELAGLRRRVASYARRVTVRSDSVGQLDVVCEIADLRRFAADVSAVAPAGAAVHAAGNVLSFEQNGRQVRVENVLRA